MLPGTFPDIWKEVFSSKLKVPYDDMIDAYAAAWTGMRIENGIANIFQESTYRFKEVADGNSVLITGDIQMRRCLFLTALFFFLLSTGCATMFAEKQDTLTIKTEPPGAEVYLGAEPLGTTPLTHTFKRSTFEQKSVNIRKEGYKTKELQLGRTLEPVALFNFGFFLTTSGATSWGIDAVTGAMIQYSPTSYFIDLEKENGVPTASKIDRRRRMHFVLWNHQALKEDIARGEGEYLSSYHRLINSPESEATFLQRTQEAAPDLLNKEDGMDFYEKLEASFHN